VDELEATLKAIPARISLTDVSSVSPLNIGVFSHTPLGYRCVWLLVGYDQLAMKVFQASHYGLNSGKERDEMLSNRGHLVRKVYGVAQHYRSFAVIRADLEQKTVIASEAVKLLGEVDLDVMTGKYVRFDTTVADKEAMDLISRCQKAVDDDQKVLLGFTLSNLTSDIFTVNKG